MENSIEPSSLSLFITTDEPVNVQVTVTSNFTNPPYLVTQTTAYGRHTVFRLPHNSTTGSFDFQVTDQSQRNKAVYIKAQGDSKVSVYAFNHRKNSGDAFQVYPCHEYNVVGLKYRYMIFSAEGTANYDAHKSQFLIIGCDRPFTNAELFPSNPIHLPETSTIISRGETGYFNIGSGHDTYLILATADLTGTVVSTSQPIALFTGHQCSQVPFGTPFCDHLVEQVPPHFTWGRVFFTIPVEGRTSGEEYRIGALDGPTIVTATCVQGNSSTPTEKLNITIAGGNPVPNMTVKNWANFTTIAGYDPEFCCIESDKPVIVMQYSLSMWACSDLPNPCEVTGDPFLAIVPPVHEYLNNFTLTTFKEITTLTVSIGVAVTSLFFDNSMSAHNSVQVNGIPLVPDVFGWKPIYCHNKEICGYVARQEIESDFFNVLHTNPRAGLYVEVTGLRRAESFGYTSGLQLDIFASGMFKI